MITFIIPTIGRDTLSKTINSLLAQTVKEWKAIVVCDGIPKINFDDKRIKCINIPKKGKLNHAGAVRNLAIKDATTQWVAFVDDDDTLGPDYVEKFNEEISLNPDAKCIIFRMTTVYDKSGIFPRPTDSNFFINKVGISFAMRKDLNLFFEPSSAEDFYLLNKIRSQNNKIIISPYVTYFVREQPKQMANFNRVKINYL